MVLADLILAESNSQDALVEELKAYGDPAIADIYQAWRVGGVFILETDQGEQALQRTDDQRWLQVSTGAVFGVVFGGNGSGSQGVPRVNCVRK